MLVLVVEREQSKQATAAADHKIAQEMEEQTLEVAAAH